MKWTFKTNGVITSYLAIDSDGNIYFGSWDKKLYALSPDGTFLWSFTTGGIIRSSPTIGPDRTNNHPHQFIYFNILAGKNFNDNFEMDYWGLSNAKAPEYITKNESGIVNVASLGTTDLNLSKSFLLKKYRNKLLITSEIDSSKYLINNHRNWLGKKIIVPANYEIFYEIKIDEIPINTIYKKIE